METIKEKKTIKTTDMVLCAMFAALIAVGAFIRIPIPLSLIHISEPTRP